MSARLVAVLRFMAVVNLLASPAVCHEEARFVVVLYPEANNGSPGNAQADRGIRTALRDAKPSGGVEIHNEYLDVSRFPGSEYQADLAKFLRRKYEGRKVDLVIAGLASGLDYALAYRVDAFPGSPIVFCAVDEKEVALRNLPQDVIGAPIHMDIADSLGVALDLLPRTRQVYVIVGLAKFDQHWEAEARRQLSPLEKQVELHYLAGLPMSELARQVAQLPENSVIYYLHVFEDGAGKVYVPAEALELIAAKANAPVFSHVESYLGRGIVGGRVFSFERAGGSAGELSARILGGEQAEGIGIQKTLENAYVFDWRQLKRWQIRESALPAGSEVRFKSASLWETYRWRIAALGGLCLLQGLLIAGLVIQGQRRSRTEAARRKIEKELRESQLTLHELTGKLLGAEETERRRIARELHDDLGQGLALLAVELDILKQGSPEDVNRLLARITKLSNRVKQLSSSVHELSHQLHPMKLEQLGLGAAIGGLCNELSDGHGLAIDFDQDGALEPLSPATALCLYRIAQEGLQNVIKHSRAAHTKVLLRGTRESLSLEIVDDGDGFEPALVADKDGIGLAGMRERARLVNGKLEIQSRPNHGTRITVRVPR